MIKTNDTCTSCFFFENMETVQNPFPPFTPIYAHFQTFLKILSKIMSLTRFERKPRQSQMKLGSLNTLGVFLNASETFQGIFEAFFVEISTKNIKKCPYFCYQNIGIFGCFWSKFLRKTFQKCPKTSRMHPKTPPVCSATLTSSKTIVLFVETSPNLLFLPKSSKKL